METIESLSRCRPEFDENKGNDGNGRVVWQWQ